MGVLDLFRRTRKQDVEVTRSALEEARDPSPQDGGTVTKMIQKILSTGLDGVGPYASAAQVAEVARKGSKNTDQAIDRIITNHARGGAAGGFITSLGGFVTMPIAIPVNVFEFYVQATRMVGAIAHLRGHDLSDPQIRSAVLLTLVGQDANKVLQSAGVPVGPIGAGPIASLALGRLPKSALMVVNKAVGFRLLRRVGEKTLAKLGRAVPIAGGVLGGALDGWMMRRIGAAARKEFPQA